MHTKQRQTQNPNKQWEVHNQQINNNITAALERTAGEGGLKYMLHKSER